MLCMNEKETTLDLSESLVNFHKWFVFGKRWTLIYVILVHGTDQPPLIVNLIITDCLAWKLQVFLTASCLHLWHV